MSRILEFIKEWLDVLLLVDLIIFQVVVVCKLVQLKGMLEKRFEIISDQLGSIFVNTANAEGNTRGLKDFLTKIEKRLKNKSKDVKKEGLYWKDSNGSLFHVIQTLDGAVYWIDDDDSKHYIK